MTLRALKSLRVFGAALTLALALLVGSAAAPAGATTLMVEDIPIFGEKSWNRQGIDPSLVERAYDLAGFAGARMARLHTGRDAAFTWEAKVDPFVADAVRRGFEPYLSLTYRRRYRHAEDKAFMGVPTPGNFGRWCGEAATRYAGRVLHYGVFNEPNYFGDGMTPELYNRLYRACHAEIKRVSPSASVYYAEIAADQHAPDPCRWMSRSLAGPQPTETDGIAIHTYQWTRPPEEQEPGAPCRGIGRLGDWRAMTRFWTDEGLLVSPDGSEPPLLITEHGYCAPHGECPPFSDGSGTSARLSEETRADYARRAFLWAQWHGVEVFSYYHLFNQPEGSGLWDSGIVKPDGNPTESVYALRQATAASRGRSLLAALREFASILLRGT